jgi:hypothetical protein
MARLGPTAKSCTDRRSLVACARGLDDILAHSFGLTVEAHTCQHSPLESAQVSINHLA